MDDIKIFTDLVEQSALNQIYSLKKSGIYSNSKIRIMPDCHAGVGCTIGTTIEIKDKITPNLVGVDIGCGMLVVKLKEKNVDLEFIDNVINEFIPSGFNINSKSKANFDFSDLLCKDHINIDRALLSIGSLGGGNHFIEIDKDKDNNLYLIIHSGSRHIGKQVADYYQKLAIKSLIEFNDNRRNTLISKLKRAGRIDDIDFELKKLKPNPFSKELSYLVGNNMNAYLHDMNITQKYAVLNRRTIANIILNKSSLTEECSFESIHNYIDLDSMILRKGAISAEAGKKLIIPINMRDGCILGIGKGNPDWNYSAPHGAGRLMGRRQAKESLNIDEFKEQMDGIYSTSISEGTLDEAPGAYKPIDEIINNITDTVEITEIIKPVYNFKAH